MSDEPRFFEYLRNIGYTRFGIEHVRDEMLTWEDGEILDDIFTNHPRLRLHDRRLFTEALADLRAAQDPLPVVDGPLPTHGTGLTPADVLRFRREWQEAGPPAPWKRAGVSEATYIRHRRKFGLVPWPEGYRRRLTP